MRLIKSILIVAVAIFAASRLLTGFVVDDLATAVVAAVVLGILNFTIKPILTILTLPINILTLGLFSLVINGFIIRLLAQLMAGMTVSSFGTGVLVSIIIAIITSVLQSMFNGNKRDRKRDRQ